MHNGSRYSAATSIFASFIIIVFVLAFIVLIVFTFYMLWRIFKKTGKPGALSLLLLVPIVGQYLVLAILAFSKWPLETELEQHRMRQGMMPPTGYPPQGQPQPPYMQYPSQSPQQYP
jgi:hypothetical protein